MNTVLVLLVAVVGGIAVAVQGQFVGLLDRSFGTLASTFVTYGGGGLIIGVIMLLSGSDRLAGWRSVPPWSLAAGAVGLIIIAAISYTVPRVGLVPALMTITVSQFAVSAVIDHYGLLWAEVRPIDLSRGSGLALLVVALWLVMR